VNVYVVVEGRIVEKAVYTSWIPLINNSLSAARYVTEVDTDNFFIVSGNGYPQYFDTILSALEDVATSDIFNRLVICIDSEDMSLQDKHQEVVDFVQDSGYAHIDYRVVVQHFCFETWALANRRIGRRHPQTEPLRSYRQFYNVHSLDPEGLPALAREGLNRSQFAAKYLRVTLNDRYKNLSYSKGNPDVVAHPKYLGELQARLNDTQHIQSFRAFLNAFV
jgi:hypothetical protein